MERGKDEDESISHFFCCNIQNVQPYLTTFVGHYDVH